MVFNKLGEQKAEIETAVKEYVAPTMAFAISKPDARRKREEEMIKLGARLIFTASRPGRRRRPPADGRC
jgi:hypothetical protein